MAEEQAADGGVAMLNSSAELPVGAGVEPLTAEVAAEIAAVTVGVADLEQQIQQLQNQHTEFVAGRQAARQHAALMAVVERERANRRLQLLQAQQQNQPPLPVVGPLPPPPAPMPAAILENGLEVQQALTARVNQLEKELQLRTEERENYKNRLQVAEKTVVDLETARAASELVSKAASADLADNTERTAVQETLEQLTDTLRTQTEQCERFERQNTQLHGQVKALKEVISVHKDLLAIRSLESDQLKTTIRLLEDHQKAEKERRAAVLSKMEAAVRLNGELKNEYETQLKIFQDLKDKYQQKVDLLMVENQRLRDLLPVNQGDPTETAEFDPEEPVVEQ